MDGCVYHNRHLHRYDTVTEQGRPNPIQQMQPAPADNPRCQFCRDGNPLSVSLGAAPHDAVRRRAAQCDSTETKFNTRTHVREKRHTGKTDKLNVMLFKNDGNQAEF